MLLVVYFGEQSRSQDFCFRGRKIRRSHPLNVRPFCFFSTTGLDLTAAADAAHAFHPSHESMHDFLRVSENSFTTLGDFDP
jgi:hypothetical protein